MAASLPSAAGRNPGPARCPEATLEDRATSSPRQVILENADPNDPNVGRENVKRGWPKGLWARDDDGQMQFVSYTVLDPDDPRSALAAAAGGDIGQRVIERAIAEGNAAPDRLDPHGATARQAAAQKGPGQVTPRGAPKG